MLSLLKVVVNAAVINTGKPQTCIVPATSNMCGLCLADGDWFCVCAMNCADGECGVGSEADQLLPSPWLDNTVALLSRPDEATGFDPANPGWLHKSNFLCAYTANELLGALETSYDDATSRLIVWKREPGSDDARSSSGEELLSERLDEATGRAAVEAFFGRASNRTVKLVRGGQGQHHFGNTQQGFKACSTGAIIHIVSSSSSRQCVSPW
jgi:hypothetical protein